MQNKYQEMKRETDRRVSAIDLNGKHIIEDCKAIIVFLKEQLTGLKAHVQTVPFCDETEEIDFFKYKKPALLGRLIYFHEILRIESQRPIGEDELDGYYEKWQEKQKLSTATWRFSSITVAEPPIWTGIFSCAGSRGIQSI